MNFDDPQFGGHSNSFPDSAIDEEKGGGGSSNEDGKKGSKKRRRFTNEEDNKIIEGVQKFFDRAKGSVDWDKVIKWAGMSRTKDQVRARYARYLTKHGSNATVPPSPSKTSPSIGQTDHVQPGAFQFQGPYIPHQGTPNSPTNNPLQDFDKESAIEIEEMQPYTKKQKTMTEYMKKEQQNPTISLHQPPRKESSANGSIPTPPAQAPLFATNQNRSTQILPPSGNSNSSNSTSIGFNTNSNLDLNPGNKSPSSPHSFSVLLTQQTQTEVSGEYLRNLRRELEEKNAQIIEFENKRRDQDERILQLQSTIQDQQTKEAERNEKYKTSLVEMLRERAERERREDKRIVDENTIRVGTITYQKAVDVYEVWQDGELFVDLERRATKITEEREKIERLKKGVTKDRTNMKKDSQERSEKQIRDTMDYFNEMEEIYKLRLSALKKEETNLNAERDKMQIEKSIQIREIKRIRDQERSRFNNMPILKERYLLIKMLGRGGFSEVYKAYDLQELRIVACKIHQLNTNWKEHRKENYIKHVLRECQIHKSVNHPRLIQMFDTFIYDNNTFVTVLEYCNGYDLDLYIKKHQRIPEKEAKSIMMQVFSGLKYMNEQKQKIIHFDLKPANILFLDDGQIKITDFGLSKIMEEEDAIELTSQGAGTYWYLPPECFEMGKVPKISPKVDVWSAGVVFYQMLYGKKPFGNDLSQQKILSERTIVNATNVSFPAKPQVSDEAKGFIRKCLTHDKDHRPDVWALYNDSYLRGSKPNKHLPGPVPKDGGQVNTASVANQMSNVLMNMNNTSTSSDGDYNL